MTTFTGDAIVPGRHNVGPNLSSGDEMERERLRHTLKVDSAVLIDQLQVRREGKDKNVRDS